MSRESQLVELLMSLFTVDELRWFLRHTWTAAGTTVAAALPGEGASAESTFHLAVDALQRRGLIVPSLFRHLEMARPKREHDIRQVAAHWRQSSGANALAQFREQTRDRADVLAQVFRVAEGPDALSKVYVDVQLAADQQSSEAGSSGSAWGNMLWPWPRRRATTPVPAGRFSLTAVLERPRSRWAVIGGPGSGKTTLLRNIALGMLQSPQRLPVLLKVTELRENLNASLSAVYGAAEARAALVEVSAGRAVLMLDGLDESLDSEQARNRVRRLVHDNVVGDCPIVLTSRPIGYVAPSADFLTLLVCPLRDAERFELLMAWVQDETRVANALGRLNGNMRLRRLTENPLLLTLVGLLLREGDTEVPARRGELYDRALQVLLTRAADPNSYGRRLREPWIARDALAWAALRLHSRSEEVYSVGSLHDTLMENKRHARNVCEFWGGPAAFVQEVAETTALLVPGGLDPRAAREYAFPHRTFREHLAAIALEREIGEYGVARPRRMGIGEFRELERVLEEAHRRPDTWSEVLALCCGLLGRGASDAVVRRIAAGGVSPLLLSVLADSEGISSDTLYEILGLERGWERFGARAELIRGLLAAVEDVLVVVRLLERFRQSTTDGNDLYWIRDTLTHIAASDAPEEARQEARSAASRIFAHLSTENLGKAKALLAQYWVDIDQGGFRMGSDSWGEREEQPMHDVNILTGYQMLAIPVTWEIYRLFDPGHDEARSDFGGLLPTADQARVPVYNVTWYAAAMFAEWCGARLPAEAEWEYACRAGATSQYANGDKLSCLLELGWFCENSKGTPLKVGTKMCNPWGLFDMHGNVWEWCLDPWIEGAYQARRRGVILNPPTASFSTHDAVYRLLDDIGDQNNVGRVFRGGSWKSLATSCRSACRLGHHPSFCDKHVGFRMVRYNRKDDADL